MPFEMRTPKETHELKKLVKNDPGAAYIKLSNLFLRLKTTEAVADELEVDSSTIRRWSGAMLLEGLDPRLHGESRVAKTEFGAIVISNPRKAFGLLKKSFGGSKTVTSVAKEYKVKPVTVRRWIESLKKAGFGDPR